MIGNASTRTKVAARNRISQHSEVVVALGVRFFEKVRLQLTDQCRDVT